MGNLRLEAVLETQNMSQEKGTVHVLQNAKSHSNYFLARISWIYTPTITLKK